jgi:uncharacterized protein YyaL (SSP411 family)
VWRQEHVRAVLDEQEYQVIARRFGLDRPANFEGKWHLHVFKNTAEIAGEIRLSEEQVMATLASARQKLFNVREERVHPGRDEKILTSWNAQMIKGMAIAGRVLGNEEFIDSAAQALDFIKSRLWKNGRLLATCKDHKAHLSAYLDDYVFLIDAILEFSQTRWRDGDLSFAVDLAEVVLEHFQDTEQGGFFFTADDHETLIHRPKPTIDDATPAGNGVAAYVLNRLGYLLGEPRYLQAAERTVKSAWLDIKRIPYAHTTLLMALEEMLYPPQSIILRGQPEALQAWQKRCLTFYAPRRLVFAIPANAKNPPDALARRVPLGEIVAYVCSGHTCSAPVTDYGELSAALKQTETSAEIA